MREEAQLVLNTLIRISRVWLRFVTFAWLIWASSKISFEIVTSNTIRSMHKELVSLVTIRGHTCVRQSLTL